MHIKAIVITLLLFLSSLPAAWSDEAPGWGGASVKPRDYQPQKVVYDVSVSQLSQMVNVIDRVSYLNKLYHADPFKTSIVLVLHGNEIPFYARKNFSKYRELVTRTQSLTVGETVKVRMCKLAAEAHGFKPEDIHGFIEMVPMADAEIIRLQRKEGHAYMR